MVLSSFLRFIATSGCYSVIYLGLFESPNG